MAKKVVIIGGVAAGMKTASRLRRRDKDAEITVVERGQQVSYGAFGSLLCGKGEGHIAGLP